MERDISWSFKNRWTSREFSEGLREFMKFTEPLGDRIYCPCKRCMNGSLWSRAVVQDHIFNNGFSPSYTIWYYHGEKMNYTGITGLTRQINRRGKRRLDDRNTGLNSMINELQAGMQHENTADDRCLDGDSNTREAETSDTLKFINDANVPLFEGASISKFHFLVRLFHLKVENHWTNKSFDKVLALQKLVNPNADLPKDYREAKKIIAAVGFSYEKIHACPNDCMLYMGEDKDLQSCKTCQTERFIGRQNVQSSEGSSSSSSNLKKMEKRIPKKVLRYFSVKKRLQTLFMCSQTAENMTWHADGRNKDGHLRHPADGEEWSRFDSEYPDFAAEPRNVRLGLSADGLEPFKGGESLSLWPVTIVVYNLPPWMCMKPSYTQMPLLIPGPGSPTQDIDVYLRPLIEELKELWSDGIRIYDAHKKEWFTMRAVLLWTINDFPAYAMLSGWSTKGYLACPVCQENTHSEKIGRRICYTGNRRHLESMTHPYRRDRRHFDGNPDFRPPLSEPTGLKAYEAVRDIHVTFGKKTTETLGQVDGTNWRKNSIFNDLPYWRFLNLRHNLDVMHIEKNVCELLLNTLLNVQPKSKVDTLVARQWFVQNRLRPELHPIDKENGRWAIPPAKYTMSTSEKDKFLKSLKAVRVPDGYSANISKCVNLKEKKLNPLKSHDCHIIMQQLLPIAIRVLSDSDVVSVVTDLCHFFRDVCSKEYTGNDFQLLERKVVSILCRLEMLFPPTLFTIMLHLCLHLPREARLGGPVQYRYMYPFERMMFKLKRYIRNKSRPAGSIAEGWLAEECINFCSFYLEGVDNALNRPSRNDDVIVANESEISVFRTSGKIIGATSNANLLRDELDSIHRWVLFNCEEIEPFIRYEYNSYYILILCYIN